MTILVISAVVAIVMSAFCSMSESALYSLPWSTIEQMRKQGRKVGDLLFSLRMDIEKPITVILTLNTIATSAGAAIVGASAASYFGGDTLVMFTSAFTVTILLFGEIIPKTLGVVYAKGIATALARPLQYAVYALWPIIWVSSLVVRLIQPKKKGPSASEEDIHAIVSLTRKAGIIEPYEELSIVNILTLDRKIVRDIMTPRTVVFFLPMDMTVAEAKMRENLYTHSRIPVFDEDPDEVVGVIYRRDILKALANDFNDKTVGELMKPPQFVIETLSVNRLLLRFLESRMHLFIVIDEYGAIQGVVSLEDVVEEILGKEIVDETDRVADLRELARTRRGAEVKAQKAGS